MSYGSNICEEGFTIGEEHPDYTGGAFDGSLDNAMPSGSWYAYRDGSYVNTGWTGQDFGSGNEKTVAKYRLVTTTGQRTYDPKNWTLEASDTGAWGGEEVVLDTQNNQSFSEDVWNEYEIANENAYRYYRINVTANNGSDTYLVVSEIEMFEAVSSSSSSSSSVSSSSSSRSSSSSSSISSSSSKSSSSSSKSLSSSSKSSSSSSLSLSSSSSSSKSSSSESSSSSSRSAVPAVEHYVRNTAGTDTDSTSPVEDTSATITWNQLVTNTGLQAGDEVVIFLCACTRKNAYIDYGHGSTFSGRTVFANSQLGHAYGGSYWLRGRDSVFITEHTLVSDENLYLSLKSLDGSEVYTQNTVILILKKDDLEAANLYKYVSQSENISEVSGYQDGVSLSLPANGDWLIWSTARFEFEASDDPYSFRLRDNSDNYYSEITGDSFNYQDLYNAFTSAFLPNTSGSVIVQVQVNPAHGTTVTESKIVALDLAGLPNYIGSHTTDTVGVGTSWNEYKIFENFQANTSHVYFAFGGAILQHENGYDETKACRSRTSIWIGEDYWPDNSWNIGAYWTNYDREAIIFAPTFGYGSFSSSEVDVDFEAQELDYPVSYDCIEQVAVIFSLGKEDYFSSSSSSSKSSSSESSLSSSSSKSSSSSSLSSSSSSSLSSSSSSSLSSSSSSSSISSSSSSSKSSSSSSISSSSSSSISRSSSSQSSSSSSRSSSSESSSSSSNLLSTSSSSSSSSLSSSSSSSSFSMEYNAAPEWVKTNDNDEVFGILTVQAVPESYDEFTFHLWNNKGIFPGATLTNVKLGVACSDGSFSGKTNYEGQEAVDEKWISVKSDGAGGNSFDPIVDDANTVFKSVGGAFDDANNYLSLGDIPTDCYRVIYVRLEVPSDAITHGVCYPALVLQYELADPSSSSSSSSYNSTTKNDDFTGDDGDLPDSNTWEEIFGPPIINSNKCRFEVSHTHVQEYIETRYFVSGEFDIQVEYSLDTYPDTSWWKFRLKAEEVSGGNKYWYCARAYDGTEGQVHIFEQRDDDLSQNEALILYGGQTGKLRLVRENGSTTIKAYYWYSGSWTEIVPGANITSSEDMMFSLQLICGDNKPNVVADFDNFTLAVGQDEWT